MAQAAEPVDWPPMPASRPVGAVDLAPWDRDAPDGPAAVIVLDPLLREDHDTCRIGCTPAAVARAAAAAVRRLLPEGGDVVLCAPSDADELTAARIAALANTLGFDPAKLR